MLFMFMSQRCNAPLTYTTKCSLHFGIPLPQNISLFQPYIGLCNMFLVIFKRIQVENTSLLTLFILVCNIKKPILLLIKRLKCLSVIGTD